jgi:hypothetical protein
MSRFVGAKHEFHAAAFVQGWADRFVPTPPRIDLFNLILERVSTPCLPRALSPITLAAVRVSSSLADSCCCFAPQ